MTNREKSIIFGLLSVLVIGVGAIAFVVIRDHQNARPLSEQTVRDIVRKQTDAVFERHVNRLDENLAGVRQSVGEVANRVDSLEAKMLKLESATDSRQGAAEAGNANK